MYLFIFNKYRQKSHQRTHIFIQNEGRLDGPILNLGVIMQKY